MERLKHSKLYPHVIKSLVGLIIALVGAMCFTFGSSALNVAVSTANLTVNNSTTQGNATLWTDITLDYWLVPTDVNSHYNLTTASNPRNRVVCFSNSTDNISTTRYFDVKCGSAYSADYTTEYNAYVRTYIEQITSGYNGDSNYRSGVRISVRIVLDGNAPTDYNSLNYNFYNVSGTHTINDVGDQTLKVRYNYRISETNAQKVYADGYADGYTQMDMSGLSATQTAFGVISAPINAIANVVQSASIGWFSTPVGAVTAWIIAILVIGGAVLFIIKVVIG